VSKTFNNEGQLCHIENEVIQVYIPLFFHFQQVWNKFFPVLLTNVIKLVPIDLFSTRIFFLFSCDKIDFFSKAQNPPPPSERSASVRRPKIASLFSISWEVIVDLQNKKSLLRNIIILSSHDEAFSCTAVWNKRVLLSTKQNKILLLNIN